MVPTAKNLQFMTTLRLLSGSRREVCEAISICLEMTSAGSADGLGVSTLFGAFGMFEPTPTQRFFSEPFAN